MGLTLQRIWGRNSEQSAPVKNVISEFGHFGAGSGACCGPGLRSGSGSAFAARRRGAYRNWRRSAALSLAIVVQGLQEQASDGCPQDMSNLSNICRDREKWRIKRCALKEGWFQRWRSVTFPTLPHRSCKALAPISTSGEKIYSNIRRVPVLISTVAAIPELSGTGRPCADRITSAG
jgi:hypothetical protein